MAENTIVDSGSVEVSTHDQLSPHIGVGSLVWRGSSSPHNTDIEGIVRFIDGEDVFIRGHDGRAYLARLPELNLDTSDFAKEFVNG